MDIRIVKYNDSYESRWDSFVTNESVNGTFLQSRNFLNYHPNGRFDDDSVMVMNGTNIIAVIPANKKIIEGKKTFISHMGSTFGGIVLNHAAYNVSYLEHIMPAFEEYLKEEQYESAILKSTSDLFSKESMGLLDYEYFRYGYNQYNEIAFYLQCNKIPEDGLSMMSSSRRRDYRYSLKNDYSFQLLSTDEQIHDFYLILEENLKKFDTVPVHTETELLEFKNKRLKDTVQFYGVYEQEQLVAGSMLFSFGKKVLHTQYLACLPEYNRKFAMNYMDFNLIMTAKREGYSFFSFGTSTGNHGKELNVGLALYKEGFGCDYSVNRTYFKDIK